MDTSLLGARFALATLQISRRSRLRVGLYLFRLLGSLQKKACNALMYSKLSPPPRTTHNCWQKSYPQSLYQLATRGGQFKDKIISHVGMLISRAALGCFVPMPIDGAVSSQRCRTSVFTTKTNHQSLNNSI